MTGLLIRLQTDSIQTLGNLLIYRNTDIVFQCKTLELSYKNNQRNISSIPEGRYIVRKEYSPRFGMKLHELKNVPQRSEIKIHAGNYYYQLNGCILVGSEHIDINKDNYKDVTNSIDTLNKLHGYLPKEWLLTIISNY